MNLVNPATKTMREKCENKRVKMMCNTEICYSMYKLSPSFQRRQRQVYSTAK